MWRVPIIMRGRTPLMSSLAKNNSPPGSSDGEGGRRLRDRSRDLETQLPGQLELDGLLATLNDVLRLNAHDATTPAASVLHVLVELSLEVGGEHLEVLLVLLGDGRLCDDRGAPFVHQGAQALLALGETGGDSAITAEGRSQQTISIGSVLQGITTSLAALFSMRVVTWLRLYLITTGFLDCTSLPPFFCSAISIRSFFFCARISS